MAGIHEHEAGTPNGADERSFATLGPCHEQHVAKRGVAAAHEVAEVGVCAAPEPVLRKVGAPEVEVEGDITIWKQEPAPAVRIWPISPFLIEAILVAEIRRAAPVEETMALERVGGPGQVDEEPIGPQDAEVPGGLAGGSAGLLDHAARIAAQSARHCSSPSRGEHEHRGMTMEVRFEQLPAVDETQVPESADSHLGGAFAREEEFLQLTHVEIAVASESDEDAQVSVG